MAHFPDNSIFQAVSSSFCSWNLLNQENEKGWRKGGVTEDKGGVFPDELSLGRGYVCLDIKSKGRHLAKIVHLGARCFWCLSREHLGVRNGSHTDRVMAPWKAFHVFVHKSTPWPDAKEQACSFTVELFKHFNTWVMRGHSWAPMWTLACLALQIGDGLAHGQRNKASSVLRFKTKNLKTLS